LGLTCNGTARPQQLLKKSGLQPGQALILTKALGTGTLFAAAQQGQAKGRWLTEAIAAMTHSNANAAACLSRYGATACTDVSGFGLLGHLMEMVDATTTAATGKPVQVTLALPKLPLLPGAAETLAQGIFSSLHPENQQVSAHIQNNQQVCPHPRYPILFDPQTAGGLLAAVPKHQADACLAALWEAGYDQSTVIGTTSAQAVAPPITIKG
ncbi:MAG: selenide, water dikinase SelD, partial [Cyanobacteria bacterium P01_A01_bin.135]